MSTIRLTMIMMLRNKKNLKWWIGGVVVLLLIGFFMSQGPKELPEEVVQEKIPFFIQTATIEDLSSITKITKHGTLMGSQEISISSQVFGRVASIPVRAGEDIKKNALVVGLQDTSSSATFQAQRAQVQLNTTRSSYDLTVTQLDQAVVDARNSWDQAKAQYEAVRQNGGSTATLQTEQLDEQVAKAELDYQSLVSSNQQTIQNYISTSKNIARDIELLYQDITTSSDQLLGASDLNEQANDYFENSLGAQNSSTRREAQGELRILLTKKSMFTNMSSTYTESNLIASLQDLKLRLQQLTPTLDKIEVMLQYTTATSSLPQTQIDGYKATVDAYQLQVQTKSSAITEQINLMQSFFSSYKDNQSSALKQKELIEQQARVTESTLGDSEEIALLQVQRAEATYNQTLTNKQKNIPSLKNTIDQAQIALSEAYDQLNKFEVLTPIDGTVGQVLVDVGQEVSAGTPLVTIKSTNSQQVEIALTQEELAFVTVGQEVSVTNGDEKVPGIIMSISKSADQFFTYPAIVELTEIRELFGDLVSVEIEVRTEYPLIPLNVITILNNNEGLINRREDEEIAPLRVQLGKVWGEFIEIRTKLEEDLVVIVSDVKNYNSTRHTLEEQK